MTSIGLYLRMEELNNRFLELSKEEIKEYFETERELRKREEEFERKSPWY